MLPLSLSSSPSTTSLPPSLFLFLLFHATPVRLPLIFLLSSSSSFYFSSSVAFSLVGEALW